MSGDTSSFCGSRPAEIPTYQAVSRTARLTERDRPSGPAGEVRLGGYDTLSEKDATGELDRLLRQAAGMDGPGGSDQVDEAAGVGSEVKPAKSWWG